MELDVNKVQEVKEVVLENLEIMKNVLESEWIELLKERDEDEYDENCKKVEWEMFSLESDFRLASHKVYFAIKGILDARNSVNRWIECNIAEKLECYANRLDKLMIRIRRNVYDGKENWLTIRKLEVVFQRYSVTALDDLDYFVKVLGGRWKHE